MILDFVVFTFQPNRNLKQNPEQIQVSGTTLVLTYFIHFHLNVLIISKFPDSRTFLLQTLSDTKLLEVSRRLVNETDIRRLGLQLNVAPYVIGAKLGAYKTLLQLILYFNFGLIIKKIEE